MKLCTKRRFRAVDLPALRSAGGSVLWKCGWRIVWFFVADYAKNE